MPGKHGPEGASSIADRLHDPALPTLAARGLAVPAYDRYAAGPRIVHVGVGGFHRSHQAVYLDELAARGSAWRIVGIGPRPGDRAMVDALASQDRLYTVIARGPERADVRVVGSLVDHVLAGVDATTLTERVAEPATSIVSLTITEAGYGPEAVMVRDGVFAGLVRGIARRAAARLSPVTVLSCDNIRHNGAVAMDAVLRAAREWAPGAAAYLERECTFPDAMVDRITPATADADRDWLRAEYGIDDRWPVVCEEHRRWVIEDLFAGGRPPLEDVGVLITDDVAAWETYKLRMLNATHTVVAYVAALAGIGTVPEAMATPHIRRLVDTFLSREVLPTIEAIAGHPAEAYAASVVERFSSRGVADQISRICVDGSVKFSMFVMPTLERQIELGGPVRAGATALAAWARYLAVVPPADQAADTYGEEARAFAIGALGDPLRFLDLDRVIPPLVAGDPGFRSDFAAAAAALGEQGPLLTAETPT